MTSSGTSWARWVLHLGWVGWVGWSSRVHVEAGECLWRQGCEKLACSSQRGSGGRAWKTAVPSHSPPTPPPAPHTLTTPPAPLRTAPPAPTAVRDHPRGAHGGGGAHEAARPRARPRLKQQQQQQQQRPTPTLSSPLPVCRRPACEPRPVDTTRCLRRLPSAGRAARDPPECAAPSPPPPPPLPAIAPCLVIAAFHFRPFSAPFIVLGRSPRLTTHPHILPPLQPYYFRSSIFNSYTCIRQ